MTYPPREVQGFYTKDQLELLIQRRTTRRRLADAPITPAIVERGYQQRAIRRIGEAFENDHDRKALIVMATGAGKTRTVLTNAQLTPADLTELERMLAEAGIGTPDDVERAKQESQGLGLFVRSLVGLDREAAKEALGTFMRGKTLRANQIEFLDLIVDHLTENGTLEAERLYESPYTDLNALGVEGVFASAEVAELMAVLDEIRRRAA